MPRLLINKLKTKVFFISFQVIRKVKMDVEHLTCIPLDEIRAAAERLQGKVLRTPLVRLNMDVPGKDVSLYRYIH